MGLDGLVVNRIEPSQPDWQRVQDFAEQSSWIAGKHIAELMRDNRLIDWESIFAAFIDQQVVGYCTFLKEDYYPDHRYSPWISGLFVAETWRGHRISQWLIQVAEDYAKSLGFEMVYIPSDHDNLYEKYGYRKIDELVNYGGEIDSVYCKQLSSVKKG